MPASLHFNRVRFLFPVQDELGVRRVVERDNVKRDALIDNHASQEKLGCFGEIQADPPQDVFARQFDLRRNAHLEHGAANDPAHDAQYIKLSTIAN